MSTTFASYTKGGAASAQAPANDGFFPAAGDDTPF